MLIAAFAAAVFLDLAFGEPPARLHPVVWMGAVIRGLTRRAPRAGGRALVWGGFTVALTVGGFGAASWGVLRLTEGIPWLHFAVSVFLISAAFSARLLDGEVAGLQWHLAAGEIDAARAWLPRLCSRDPRSLDEGELAASGIASLAENANDSVVAPWFWMLVLGIPGMVAYRAINTLDAMIGYRGEYERLGKCAARLDDAAGWIPARLTAFVLLVSGAVQGAAVTAGLYAGAAGNRAVPSPCGGWPMGTIAGLLDVRIPKPGVYLLHPEGKPADADSMGRARRLAWGGHAAAFLGTILCLAAWGNH